MNLDNTICQEDWLIQNKDKLERFVPESWTHVDNATPLLQSGLKAAGVDWETNDDYQLALFNLFERGYIVFDGQFCRRDPRYFDYLAFQKPSARFRLAE